MGNFGCADGRCRTLCFFANIGHRIFENGFSFGCHLQFNFGQTTIFKFLACHRSSLGYCGFDSVVSNVIHKTD